MESPSIRMVPGFSMGGGGGGFGISGPTPAWAGYLGKRHDPPAPEETCPWCQAKGLTVTLRTYAINHSETIRLCPTSTCIYPLVSRPLETVLASLSSTPLADQHPSGQTSSLKESPTPLPPSAKRARTEESPVQLAAPSSTTAPTPTSLASPKDSTQEVLTEATWEDHNYVRNSDECNEDETNSRVTTCGPSNEEAQVALASDPCPANTARPLGTPTEGSVLRHDAESVATSSTAQASPSLDLGVTKPLNWLTSLLVALAQCRTLRLLSSGQQSASPWFEKLKKARDGSPLLDLCTRYQKNTALLSNQPMDLDNTMARDAENSLDDIHLSTLQLLQQPQTTKTGHGRRSAGQRLEEPAGALRALLQLDNNAKELFQHSVQWSSECLECGCDSSCSCSSTVTVHKALVSDCHPLSGPVQIACSRCQSTELKTEILQERVPPVFAVRFMNGPSINDIRTCSFSTADGQYDVTVVIQQRKQEGVADHLYTTWICQPDGSWKAYRSFLDSSGISHPRLDIPSEEVHMAFWEVERRHLHQPITSEASSAEDWPLEEDVCESIVPPDDLSVYSFHEDDTLLEALTPCNLEASAMESSISNATLLDTFEGLSHSDIVSLTLDPGNEGAKQNRKRKARGGPRGKVPKPCAEGDVKSSHVSEEVVSSPLSSPRSVRRSRRLEIKRVERKEKGDAQDEEQEESSEDPEPKTQTCKKTKTSPQNRPEKTSPRQSMAQVATVLQTPPRFVQPCKIIGMSPKATNGPPIQTGQVLMTSPNTIKRPTVLVSQLLGSSPKTTQSPLIQTGQILVTSPNSIKSPSVPVSQLLGSSPKTTQSPLIQTGQILVTSPRTTQSSSIQTVLVVSPKTTQSPSSRTGQVLVASPKATQSPVVQTGKVLLTSNTTQSPFIKAIPVLGTSPKVTPRPSVQTVQVLGTSPKATPIPSVQAIQVLRTSSVICSPSTQTNAQRGPTLIIPARKSPPKGLVIKRPRPVTPGSGTQNLLLQNVAGENSTKQASANPTARLNDAKEGKTLNQVFLVSSPNRSVPLVVRSPKQLLEVMPTPVMQSLPDKAISQKKPTFASPTQSSKVYVKKRPTIEPQSPTMSIPIPLNITPPPADTQKTLIPVLATQSTTLPSPAMGTSALPPVAANSAASPSGSKSPPTLDQAVLNPASPLKSQSPKASDITVQSQTVFSLALENPPLQMQLAQDQPKNTLSPPVRSDLPLKSNSPQCQSLLRLSQPSLHTSVDAPKQNGVVLPEPYVSLAPIEQEPVQVLNVTVPLASSSVNAVKPSLPATSSKIQLEQKTDTVSIQSTNESTSSESPPLSSPPKLKRFIPIPECPPFCETLTENQTQGPTTNSLSKPDPVMEITLGNVVEESSLPTKALEEIAQMIEVSEVQKENQGNKETSTPALSTTSHKSPSPPQTLASHQQTSESLKEKQQTSESLGEDQQTSESLGDQQTSECALGDHQMSESVGDHQTSLCVKGNHPTSLCVKGNHQTSVCVKEDHQTSECEKEDHQASESLRDQQTSGGLIEDQQTSACVRDDEPSPDTIITLDLDIVMDGSIGNEESIPELILPTVISSSHLQLASPQPTAVETSAWTAATPSPPPLTQSTITTAPSTHSSSMGPQCSPSPPQTCHSASYPANAKSNKAPSPLQSTTQQTVPAKPPQRAEKPAGPKITLKHDPDTPMMQHHMFTGFKTQQRASSNSTGLNGSNSSPQEGTTEQLTSKPSPTQPTSLVATRLAALTRTSMGSTASVKGQAAALVGAKRSQTPASQDVEAAALRLKLLKKLKAKKQQLAKLDQMMAKRGGVSHPSSAPPSVQAYPSSTTSSPASSHQLPSPQTSETLSPEGTDMLEMLVSGPTDNLKSVLENASTHPPLQHLQQPSNGAHPAPHADFLTIDDFLDDVIFDTTVTQKTGENPDFDDTLDMFL